MYLCCRHPGFSVHRRAEEPADADMPWFCPRPRLSTQIYDSYQTEAGVYNKMFVMLYTLYVLIPLHMGKINCVLMCEYLCQILEGLQQTCNRQKEENFIEARRDAVKTIAQ